MISVAYKNGGSSTENRLIEVTDKVIVLVKSQSAYLNATDLTSHILEQNS